jgi:uncharacterized protein YndB with AHSA1/START domain
MNSEEVEVITDPLTTAGLVDREVRTGTRDGQPTRLVVARRTYPTERADLWQAITDRERLPRWFLPVTGDLHEGGRYQLEGNAGGTVERCDPPSSFAVTWEFGGHVSWLRVGLEPASDGTTLELVHEAPVDPEFWAQFGPGAAGVGWDLGLLGLGLHLEDGAAADPEVALRWPTTPDGTSFVRHAARGWAEAAVADGDEAAPANVAAERTVAFYTVEPEG